MTDCNLYGHISKDLGVQIQGLKDLKECVKCGHFLIIDVSCL